MATTEGSNPKGATQEQIEAVGIDRICEMIIEGALLREVAKKIGIKGHASLLLWISNDPARAKAVEAARKLAAYSAEESALDSIRKARSKLALAKAREEASHQRWRASKMNPQFADKVDVKAELTGANGGPIEVARIELVPMVSGSDSKD